MNLKTFCIGIFSLIISCNNPQKGKASEIQSEAGEIVWAAEQPLTWDDFLGKPNYNITAAAMSSTGLHYEYEYAALKGDSLITIKVNTVFKKNKSWAKKELQTKSILRHEQLHFDIAELTARKIKRYLNSHIITKYSLKEIKEYFYLSEVELGRLQNLYDKQTIHSQDREKQRTWEIYTSKELQRQ